MALYLVGTPIGNLDDFSPRALKVLKSAPLILVEKWADSIKLLNKFEIKPETLWTYNDENRKRTTPKILEILAYQDVALITSAGMPGVSDPGPDLVTQCYRLGIKVIPIPGPSALTTAISASGFRGNFLFASFLPRKTSHITIIFDEAKSNEYNLVFFESPYRLTKTLNLLAEHSPNSQVFIGKEMTKMHEAYIKGRPAQILEMANADKNFLKGEFTLVINFEEVQN